MATGLGTGLGIFAEAFGRGMAQRRANDAEAWRKQMALDEFARQGEWHQEQVDMANRQFAESVRREDAQLKRLKDLDEYAKSRDAIGDQYRDIELGMSQEDRINAARHTQFLEDMASRPYKSVDPAKLARLAKIMPEVSQLGDIDNQTYQRFLEEAINRLNPVKQTVSRVAEKKAKLEESQIDRAMSPYGMNNSSVDYSSLNRYMPPALGGFTPMNTAGLPAPGKPNDADRLINIYHSDGATPQQQRYIVNKLKEYGMSDDQMLSKGILLPMDINSKFGTGDFELPPFVDPVKQRHDQVAAEIAKIESSMRGRPSWEVEQEIEKIKKQLPELSPDDTYRAALNYANAKAALAQSKTRATGDPTFTGTLPNGQKIDIPIKGGSPWARTLWPQLSETALDKAVKAARAAKAAADANNSRNKGKSGTGNPLMGKNFNLFSWQNEDKKKGLQAGWKLPNNTQTGAWEPLIVDGQQVEMWQGGRKVPVAVKVGTPVSERLAFVQNRNNIDRQPGATRTWPPEKFQDRARQIAEKVRGAKGNMLHAALLLSQAKGNGLSINDALEGIQSGRNGRLHFPDEIQIKVDRLLGDYPGKGQQIAKQVRRWFLEGAWSAPKNLDKNKAMGHILNYVKHRIDPYYTGSKKFKF